MNRSVIGIVIGLYLVWGDLGWTQSLPSGDVQKGEQVYNKLCWTCHGRYGRGDGPAAQYLTVTPPDFTDPSVLADTPDQALIDQIVGKGTESGGAHMPMVLGQVLDTAALRDALAYIRTLSVPGEHVSIRAGRDIYNTFCWGCHGVKGDGKGPAAKNLVGAKPRDFTAKDFVITGREEELFRTIFLGAAQAYHGSPYMPPWKTSLSQQQIRDLIAYLKTFKPSKNR
ncbi:MAG: hypothetical protein D6736_01900 [Nitrospinota bacterium]|nr:MAG: hypothetical protein D6736_01900 [Nitrospinota bacterium]